MNDNDKTLLSDLDSLRVNKGWSQREVGHVLGISQGHLSKLLDRKVPISLRMRARIRGLLADGDNVEASEIKLETDVIAAVRSSSAFRALVLAALEMHKNK